MYIDTAILVKLVVREPDSLHYAHIVDGKELCTSELARTECLAAMLRKERERALDRPGRERAWKQVEADVAAGRLQVLPVTPEVLVASRRILQACHPQVALRSLDAIHLASAEHLQSWPLCTNDARMREAATLLGMALCPLP